MASPTSRVSEVVGAARGRLAALPRLSAREVLWVALASGMAMGAAEALYKEFNFRLADSIGIDPWVAGAGLWLTPLTVAVLFGVSALFFVLAARLVRVLAALPVPVFLYAFLACFLLIRGGPFRIHSLAGLVLSIGVGTAMARTAMAAPVRWLQRVRGFGLGMSLAMFVLAVGGFVVPRVAEQRALSSLGDPPQASAPNVLLLVLDTVRASSMSLYGYARPTTPELERIARDGYVFDLALATAPWTLPSHATMFTGHLGSELSTSWGTPLDASFPTVAEVLSAHGYATGGFVGNLSYTRRQSGLSRGYHHYEDYLLDWGTVLGTTWALRRPIQIYRSVTGDQQKIPRKRAPGVTKGLLRWVRGIERPFFAFLNIFDAHDPYLPPSPYAERFAQEQSVYWVRNHRVIEDGEALRDHYDDAITYVDAHVGRLYDSLDAAGVLENTWVLVTADHGEQFGEHGLLLHGNSAYRQVLQVPLIVVPPASADVGLRRGTRISTPVSLRDLAATLVDLAGVDRHPLPGSTLASSWGRGDQFASDSALSPVYSEAEGWTSARHILAPEDGPLTSLLRGDWHYIRDAEGNEELYSVASDPEEVKDLARDPASLTSLRDLRLAVDSVLSTLSRGGGHWQGAN